MLLLTSCATPPAPVVRTEVVNNYLPDAFLQDCAIPYGAATYRGVLELSARREAALKACNKQLAGARDYQRKLKAQEQKAP